MEDQRGALVRREAAGEADRQRVRVEHDARGDAVGQRFMLLGELLDEPLAYEVDKFRPQHVADGPVLAAVMLAGGVGGALTAELGTMNVTEQLVTLRVMGSDPIRYLVVPRFVTCVLLTPILTIYSDMLGVIGGWLIAVKFLGVPSAPYWYYSAQGVDNW